MTQLVPVARLQPGGVQTITLVPLGIQLDVPYVLRGPDGTRVVFNDSGDPDFVGYLDELSGFDSPDVRESADNLVEGDGGVHGNFFYGRRPVTMTGQVWPDSVEAANLRITKLQRACDAMRQDSTLSWTTDGGNPVELRLRRQQPLRLTGRRPKQFQVGMVAADPRIYGQTLNAVESAVSANGQVTNVGVAATPPLLTVFGPGVNPRVSNLSTGETLIVNRTLTGGDYLVLDVADYSVLVNNAVSAYAQLDFIASVWWLLEPGINTVNLGFDSYSGSPRLRTEWRDAWL